MMIKVPNFSQTLSLIRMERLHVLSSKWDFIKHIYTEILHRQPEKDPSAYSDDLPPGDVNARLDYVKSVLFSDESDLQRHANYDAYLDAFLSGLGYKSSRIYLSELLKNLYPTLEEFKESFPDILLAVAKNTQLALLRLAADENFVEWNSSVNLSIIADRLVAFEDTMRKLQDAMESVAWLIRDLKSSAAQQSRPAGADLNTELLLTIIAKLDMAAGK